MKLVKCNKGKLMYTKYTKVVVTMKSSTIVRICAAKDALTLNGSSKSEEIGVSSPSSTPVLPHTPAKRGKPTFRLAFVRSCKKMTFQLTFV